MYADQLSPVGTLFKFEQFDPPQLRDAVGRLIFGAYENELYANELRIRELDREFANVSSELGAINKLIGASGQVLTPSWLAAERSRIEAERALVEADIATAEMAIYEAGASESLSLRGQQDAYIEVQKLQSEISKLTQRIDVTKFEIADADRFIGDLERKLIALNDSSATSNAFGRVTFQYCPACYSAIESDQPAHACHLCKNPFDSERARTRVVSLINDTAKQLKQSRGLQRDRTGELAKAEVELTRLNAAWKSASEKLVRFTRTPTSAARDKLRALQRSSGYIDRQLEDLSNKEALSAEFEKLIARKAKLNEDLTRLNERNALLRNALNRRLLVAYSEVEKEILTLLRGDLPREEAFIKAQTVQFDFPSNKLSVDNQSYFSASSRVILRNSFFVGLFAAATKDPSFRHLRICMLDSIEDKGMQPERSHNFQRMVVKASQAALSEHQIIFATSMIAPELDVPNLTVGHYSTLENHTLAFQSPSVSGLV